MRLKVFTTLCMMTVLVMLVFYTSLIGRPPGKKAPVAVRKEYASRTLDYLCVLLVAFVGSGVGAALVLRRARAEYSEESLKNIKELLDAATEAKQAKEAKKAADGSSPD